MNILILLVPPTRWALATLFTLPSGCQSNVVSEGFLFCAQTAIEKPDKCERVGCTKQTDKLTLDHCPAHVSHTDPLISERRTQSGVKGHRFRNCRNFRQFCRQFAGNFSAISGNFRQFPEISGNFRQFPQFPAISAISGNFRQFPAISAISGNFRKFWQFPALKFCRRFPDFRNFPAISGNFAGFPENPRLAVVSVQQNPCFALILAQHERFQRFKVVLLPH